MRRSTSVHERRPRKGLAVLIAVAALAAASYFAFVRRPSGLEPVPGGRLIERAAPPGFRVVEQKVVELNTATLAEVETLPGITPEYAQKIIDGRPYRSMADLSRTGIPRRILDEISPPAVIRLNAPAPASAGKP